MPFSKLRRNKEEEGDKESISSSIPTKEKTVSLPAPIRRVDDAGVVEIIWTGEKSIVGRILMHLDIDGLYTKKIPLWNKAENKKGFPYYWNSKTKEATWKVPDAVKKMQADSGKDETRV